MESLCERVEKKELHPHLYEAFPLERANEAMEVMREKKKRLMENDLLMNIQERWNATGSSYRAQE